MATSKVKKWQPEAHPAAINALQILPEGLVASGDDDGCIKLWDPRQAQAEALASFSEHTDFIADFAYQVRPTSFCLPLFASGLWLGMQTDMHQSQSCGPAAHIVVNAACDAVPVSSECEKLMGQSSRLSCRKGMPAL